MKKTLALLLALTMILGLAACGKDNKETTAADTKASAEQTTAAPTTEAETTVAPTTEADSDVMTHAEYIAAAQYDALVVAAYVQAKTIYNPEWGNVSLYLADKDGAYYAYRLPCATQEEYDKMTIGSKLKITGYKTFFKGMPEIDNKDVVYEVVEGDTYVAPAVDLTGKLGDLDYLAGYIGCKFTVTGVVVADAGEGAAFLYNWNGSGSKGDDIYFYITEGEAKVQALIETDICAADSEVYAAAENLQVGAKVTVEGFLYWYDGPNPHITSISTAK